MRAVLLLSLVAISSQALANADKFDLVCAGQLSVMMGAPQPSDDHLRIDLASRRYCEADCSAIHPIAEVQPGSIILEQSSNDEDARGRMMIRAIDRRTGDYIYMTSSRSGAINLHSHCEPAPFSGFPKLDTQF